ncbi:MAG: hypothetical protein JWM28_4446 [Chitinophagaceae bacterium]|nr:hypothetical protein [Chitinophagaceae bacterium]
MANTTAIRSISGQIKPLTRCKRGATQSYAERTRRTNRNGFLRHQFKPFWQYNDNRAGAEREFLCSLSILCKYYELPIPETLEGSFPHYIYQTQQVLSEKLKAVDNKVSCIIAKDERHIATLATLKRFDTNMTLYYIPVRPLWHWVQCSQSQPLAELIIAVFAYLEQVVKVPYYTEQDSYLASQYETLEQWVNDDQEDEKYRNIQLDELYTMQNAGLKIYQQIIEPQRLIDFERVVQNFQCKENWQNDWLEMAVKFLQLYMQYPERSVFDHIHSDLLYPQDEDRIYADQYISFYWSGNDCFQDCLFEMIDNHFQEIAYMDEPAHVQLFDYPPLNTTPDFDFETRLFELINELSRLLNHYDHEQREPTI